jgi:hypothetical protein
VAKGDTWRRLAKIAGETFREGGILVIVFGLLDNRMADHPHPPPWDVWIIGIGLIGIVLGAILEARNHDR